jgi:SRSO17 transposase
MGCAGGVENGINIVHAAWIREGTGQVLAGFRQWSPEEHVMDPVRSLVTALPPDLAFKTKGELAIGIFDDAIADGLVPDFVCGDEVYGSCTKLREHLEQEKQGYVLRVQKSFRVTLGDGTVLTCEDVVKKLLRSARLWEVRTAGKGSKGERLLALWRRGHARPTSHCVLPLGSLASGVSDIVSGSCPVKARCPAGHPSNRGR